MKGSSNGKGSGSSAYSGRSNGPRYSGIGGKAAPYLKKGALGCGGYQSKGLGSYLPNANSGIRYQPPIPSGYSKGGPKGSSKGGYLEMAISDFSTPFGQQAPKFNVCQVCGVPVPAPFKKCLNCSATSGQY